jgi:hypothetical protein
MRFLQKTILFPILTTAFCSNALANDDLWVGLKAGTLGFGAEVSWRPIRWLDVRAGGNFFDYNDAGSQAGVNYDATLSLQTIYLTGNFRFPLSPFRVTAGAFSNGNELRLVSQEMSSYELGGQVYQPSDVGILESRTSFESVSPYVGAGFDFSLMNRLGLSLDFGVLWQGDPIVTLTADGALASNPVFLDDLEFERQQLVEEFKDFKAYPVISVGFNFNF